MSNPSPTPAGATLTDRESELKALMDAGKSRSECAEIMGISPPRVTQLSQSLRGKLGLPVPKKGTIAGGVDPDIKLVRQIAARQRHEPTFTWARAGREMGIAHVRLAKARQRANESGVVPLPPCDLPCDMMTMCKIINRWGLAVSDALAYGAKNPQTVKDLLDASTLMEAIYEGTADPFAASMITSFAVAAGRVSTLAQNDRAAEARARALDKLRPPAAVNGVALPMMEDHPARRMQEIMAEVIPQLLAENDERKAREARERQD
jgi:hypothetical protein